ncbi:serine hydrolase domain-containing protein [Myroides odoratimimus]|uniref:serine hydrolase domain-containing protein n=1 Tax=Myroides odoratimimus TaxID=76832 RepID=UPI0038D4939D
MKPYKYLLLLIILLGNGSINAFAQANIVQKIDSLIVNYNKLGNFNGNILVAKDNHIIYESSLGYTDATKTNKLTLDYKFNIGSITKEFSAVALAQLEGQGRLNLSDKVSKYMPEFPLWANQVRIKNLLDYTSGIPDVNWKQINGDKDILAGLLVIDSLDFAPGTTYDYNNNNLFLRQLIVEKISKTPFKAYTEQFIFKPCDMSTAVMTPIENEDNIAKGFSTELKEDKKDLPITGGTYLTVLDLYKWSKCLYQKKLIKKRQILKLGKAFDLEDTQSALGNTIFKSNNLIKHVHDGRAGSYEALLVSNLNQNWTIILLSNSHTGKLFEISDKITQILNY